MFSIRRGSSASRRCVGPDGFDFIFQSDKGLPTSLLSPSLPPRTAPYPLNHRSMRFEEGDPRRKGDSLNPSLTFNLGDNIPLFLALYLS